MNPMRNVVILMLICAMLLLNSCGMLSYKQSINDDLTGGSIKLGMLKSEVIQTLRKPDKVAARKTTYDTREVHTYYGSTGNDLSSYFFLSIFTVGIGFFIPMDHSDVHFLVYSNNVLLGWDLPDPYAADLIIEHRDR